MRESVLAKIPGFFEPFAIAPFYSSKGNRRCADCTFVRDAVGAQISIKEWLRKASDGNSAHIFWRGRCIYEGEDVFMKGKMCLWRGRCIYERENVFMKGKMYLWRGRCIYEQKDVFMKGKMCLWTGRCVYEGEDVFIKGRSICEGEDVFMKGKMYLWREKKISGIFKGIKNKMLFKNQRNSWKFSSQK